jgi:hypothetical protein
MAKIFMFVYVMIICLSLIQFAMNVEGRFFFCNLFSNFVIYFVHNISSHSSNFLLLFFSLITTGIVHYKCNVDSECPPDHCKSDRENNRAIYVKCIWGSCLCVDYK